MRFFLVCKPYSQLLCNLVLHGSACVEYLLTSSAHEHYIKNINAHQLLSQHLLSTCLNLNDLRFKCSVLCLKILNYVSYIDSSNLMSLCGMNSPSSLVVFYYAFRHCVFK